MDKYLKITDFKDISPYDLDGHKYRLEFDIGEVRNNTLNLEQSYRTEIEITDSLETIWGLNNERIDKVLGSICLSNALELAKNNNLNLLNPIALNSHNSGQKVPKLSIMAKKNSIHPF